MKILIVILFLLTASCKGGPSSTVSETTGLPPVSPANYYTHTVRWTGETVSIIAGWYTGDIENWKILGAANPGINPNRISEGLRILIPRNIMKTQSPMTKEYVDSFYPKPRVIKEPPKPAPPPPKPAAPPSKPVPPPEEEEEPVLFGPKN